MPAATAAAAANIESSKNCRRLREDMGSSLRSDSWPGDSGGGMASTLRITQNRGLVSRNRGGVGFPSAA